MKKIVGIIAICLAASLMFTTVASASVKTAKDKSSVTTVTLPYYTDALPGSYKNADYGSIKTQGWHGDCWAYSTIGTLEINLYKMGLLNSEAQDGFYDFSEQAFAWYLYGYHCLECGSTNVYSDDYSCFCLDCGSTDIVHRNGKAEFNSIENGGGYTSPALSFMVEGGGLYDDADWPHNNNYPSEPKPDGITPYDFSVESVVFGSTLEDLKRMIISYGAATFGFKVFERSICMSTCSDGDSTYCTLGGKNMPNEGYHAVVAIGYDDSFAKENFKINKTAIVNELQETGKYGATKEFNELLQTMQIPTYSDDYEVQKQSDYVQKAIDYVNGLTDAKLRAIYGVTSDGAVLVKNSWGTSSDCNTGLYWIPYDCFEEMQVFDEAFFSIDKVSTGLSVDKLYTYTDYSITDFYYAPSDDPVSYMNVYDFEETSEIDFVSIYAYAEEEVPYKLYYAAVCESGAVCLDDKVLMGEGIIEKNVFYTRLDVDGFTVPARTGAIIITVPGDAAFYIGTESTGKNSYAYANIGESLVYDNGNLSMYGGEYNSIFYAGNLAIDAGVNKSDATPVSIAVDYSIYDGIADEISDATIYDEKFYSSEDWQMFIEAKEAFEAVPRDLSAWDWDIVTDACDYMTYVMECMVMLDADYSEYNKAVRLLAGVNAEDPSLTEETRNALLLAVGELAEVPKNLKANEQRVIDAATKDAIDAIDNLEYVAADYSEYEALSKAVEKTNLTKSKYTELSWNLYEAALSEFKNLASNLKIGDQDKVDSAADKLKTAIYGLEPVSDEKAEIEELQKNYDAELSKAQENYERKLSGILEANKAEIEELLKKHKEELAAEAEKAAKAEADSADDAEKYARELEEEKAENESAMKELSDSLSAQIDALKADNDAAAGRMTTLVIVLAVCFAVVSAAAIIVLGRRK